MNVFFFCPVNVDRPTGGVLVIFRCVEILRSHGINAWVVVLPTTPTPETPEIRWFSSTAPIMQWEEACALPPEQCLHVLPEDFCMKWSEDTIRGRGRELVLKGAKLLVFAQNRRDTYRNFLTDWPKILPRDRTLMGRKNLVGVLCVSPFEQAYWKTIYPDLQVWCKPNSVNTEFFRPATSRTNTAAFLGKPSALKEAQHFIYALRHSGLAEGWRFQNLQNRPQHEVAESLSKADIFISFSPVESFGLAAAEAMASGCIVIGYHGGVSEEFFNPRWSYPVSPQDHLGFLQAFQKLREDRLRMPDFVEEKRHMGRSHIERNFQPDREAKALIEIFEYIMGS